MAQDRLGGTARFRNGLMVALRGRHDPVPVAGQRSRVSAGVGDLQTRKVVDLTIRLAEVMLSSGSGTADVVATAQDVVQAYQLTDCVVDIAVTTIIVSALPAADSPPVTIVRSVHTRSTDYSRLAELDQLVQRITAGGVTVDQAQEAMDELTARPHPYARWVATAGWAGFALGIAMMFGGTWLTWVLAAVTAAVIDRVSRLLNRIGTPLFFQYVSGAAIATLVAVAAYLLANQGPSPLVVTGIMMLLSGMTLVGAVQDAVTGYMLPAVARLGEAVFLTAGIVVGILAGLQVAALAGITIELYVDVTGTFVVPNRSLPILLAVSGAALAGACLTVASYAPLRAVATAGLAAGLAEAALIGLGAAGFGQVIGPGLAAVGVGFLATLVSIRRQAPALVTATAGIIPMLPGLAIFRAVFLFAVDKNFSDAQAQLVGAATTALALGSGAVLGEFVGSPLRYRAGRIGDFFRFRIEGPPGSAGPSAGWCACGPPRAQTRPARAANDREVWHWSRRQPNTRTPASSAADPVPMVAGATVSSRVAKSYMQNRSGWFAGVTVHAKDILFPEIATQLDRPPNSRAVDGVRPFAEQIGDHCHVIFREGRPTVMREAANTTPIGERIVQRNPSWHFGRSRSIIVVDRGGQVGGSRCCDAQCCAHTHARRRTGGVGDCAVAGDSGTSRLFRAAGRGSEANSRRGAQGGGR